MKEQVFISYRRRGGDVTAKLICESLKVKGYTVFYDFDSIHGGYFDQRIFEAIEACDDFVLVLPAGSLDRCREEGDWVRGEIRYALEHDKNIIPVMLDGFSFPKDLPDDIKEVTRYNGVPFSMMYFDAMMSTIIDRLRANSQPVDTEPKSSTGLYFSLNEERNGYVVEGNGSCTDKDIIIPKMHDGLPVVAIGKLAFMWREYITSVTIPSSVTSIGEQAFSGCTSMTTVNMPSKMVSIKKGAFFDCQSLINITIPEGIAVIEKETFYNCLSLTSISLPSTLLIIGNSAFGKCKNLKSIDLNYGITDIGVAAFNECKSLTNINIPNSLTSIGTTAFAECEALQKIAIPDGITQLGYNLCHSCYALTSVTLPKKLKSIGAHAFYACHSLKNISIPDTVQIIEGCAFACCEALMNFNIPNSVTSIGESTFNGCKSITKINIPKNVEHIGKAVFNGCDCLESITVDPDNSHYKSIDGNLFSKDGSILIKYASSKQNETFIVPDKVTSIDDFALMDCVSLTNVSLPNSITSIGERAFQSTSISHINLPATLKKIDAFAFIGCDSLSIISFNGSQIEWNLIEFGKYWIRDKEAIKIIFQS